MCVLKFRFFYKITFYLCLKNVMYFHRLEHMHYSITWTWSSSSKKPHRSAHALWWNWSKYIIDSRNLCEIFKQNWRWQTHIERYLLLFSKKLWYYPCFFNECAWIATWYLCYGENITDKSGADSRKSRLDAFQSVVFPLIKKYYRMG